MPHVRRERQLFTNFRSVEEKVQPWHMAFPGQRPLCLFFLTRICVGSAASILNNFCFLCCREHAP